MNLDDRHVVCGIVANLLAINEVKTEAQLATTRLLVDLTDYRISPVFESEVIAALKHAVVFVALCELIGACELVEKMHENIRRLSGRSMFDHSQKTMGAETTPLRGGRYRGVGQEIEASSTAASPV